MTTPTTTPGTLGRARARIAATPPTNERSLPRRAPRGSLLASLLATAVVALAAAGAQADPHPDHRPTYKVTADLDGRTTPAKGDFTTIEREDFLRKGQRVPVICQANGGLAYGSRLWDLVSSAGDTLFVPDRFIKTGTNGRAPEIRRCTKRDLKKVTGSPPPTNHP